MKKIKINLLIVLVLVILIVIILGNFIKVKGKIDKRFVYVNSEVYFDIYYDKETKVMYAVSTGQYNKGNIVMLVNANGKPLLYGED